MGSSHPIYIALSPLSFGSHRGCRLAKGWHRQAKDIPSRPVLRVCLGVTAVITQKCCRTGPSPSLSLIARLETRFSLTRSANPTLEIKCLANLFLARLITYSLSLLATLSLYKCRIGQIMTMKIQPSNRVGTIRLPTATAVTIEAVFGPFQNEPTKGGRFKKA